MILNIISYRIYNLKPGSTIPAVRTAGMEKIQVNENVWYLHTQLLRLGNGVARSGNRCVVQRVDVVAMSASSSTPRIIAKRIKHMFVQA